MTFLDITAIPVPSSRKAEYVEYCRRTSAILLEHGATSVMDYWGEDVPLGKITDYRKAVCLRETEEVAVGLVAWPDRATRDSAWAKVVSDDRMSKHDMPFDGGRMIFGGFGSI